MLRDKLTPERLRELLHYDPLTGEFSRLKMVRGARRLERTGNVRPDGYIRIGVDYCSYLAHRLAWLYMTGEWPKHFIDHIDGNPSNNKFSNLRDVPQMSNVHNIHRPHRRNRSGVLGVSLHPRDNLWRARIMVDGKSKTLGYFKTIEQAQRAYATAKQAMHHLPRASSIEATDELEGL